MLLPTDLHQFKNTWDIIITGRRNIFRLLRYENRYLSILKIFLELGIFLKIKNKYIQKYPISLIILTLISRYSFLLS